jgi:hypothetical protein
MKYASPTMSASLLLFHLYTGEHDRHLSCYAHNRSQDIPLLIVTKAELDKPACFLDIPGGAQFKAFGWSLISQ